MATTSCGGSSNIIFILEDLSFLSLWEASSGLRGCASCPQIKNIVVVVVVGQKKKTPERDRQELEEEKAGQGSRVAGE